MAVKYLLSRLALFVASILLILVVAFFVVYRLPGDPARMILGPRADAETVQRFRTQAGLDRPIWLQFGGFATRSLRLDFGDSLIQRRPVIQLIRERAGYTLKLVAYALAILVWFAILLPLALSSMGLHSADRVVRSLWGAAAAAPPYVLALITLVVMAGFLRWLPAVFEPDRFICWLFPSAVLAVYPTSLVSRLFANALERAMTSDYAVRARAQGFPDRVILLKEAVINAATAPVSALANGLAYFVTGTFFVEAAFGIGGLGTLTYDSIRNKDVTVLASICLLFAFVVSAVSAVLDLSQHLMDPRLRRSHEWIA